MITTAFDPIDNYLLGVEDEIKFPIHVTVDSNLSLCEKLSKWNSENIAWLNNRDIKFKFKLNQGNYKIYIGNNNVAIVYCFVNKDHALLFNIWVNSK